MSLAITKVAFALLTTGIIASSAIGVAPPELDAYDTVFTRASRDEADSIPLGNGTTGINLWVESNGDLLFYVSRNDAITEMHRLVKLGRVRLKLTPNPFANRKPYQQRLNLRSGSCTIVAGESGSTVRLKVFVDSDSQTIYVSGSADKRVHVTATLENWRTKQNDLSAQGTIGSTWIFRDPPPAGEPTCESPDIVASRPNSITWYHSNPRSPVPIHIKGQSLQNSANLVVDPIANRVFGARIFGPGFGLESDKTLTIGGREGVKEFDLRVATHSAQESSPDKFLAVLAKRASIAPKSSVAANRTAKWWQRFWGRSWVFVDNGLAEGSVAVPPGRHPLRFGASSDGGGTIRGGFGRVSVFGRALDADEVAKLAATKLGTRLTDGALASTATRGFEAKGDIDVANGIASGGFLEAINSTSWKFPKGLTLEAHVKSEYLASRIFDKITPGGSDGFLLDGYGGKLRLVVGDRLLYGSVPLPVGQWVHVAATIDTKSGQIALYQDGKRVGGAIPVKSAVPSRLTQAYVLTKYQLACQERSSFPAHFNGGIFTVAPEFAYYATDPRGKNWSADYRFYGPSYWWQNTRFMYQLHLAQGNFDLTDSFFDFYFRNKPVLKAQAKAHYNADGIFMNEVLSLFGLPGMGDFGWGADEYSEGYTRNIWQQCLEFGAFALDRFDYTGDRTFLKKTIEWCDDALKFYDTRFKKDAHGKMVINPTHAVETYWTGVTNDMPSVAGLYEITDRLLALPVALTSQKQRSNWKRIRAAIPALPKTLNKDGKVIPDNAEKYKPERTNYESPDLYCVYPFRLYGLGRTAHDIDEARRAWRAMPNPGHCCWYQTGINAARLGLTDGAKEDILIRSDARTQLAVVDGKGRSFRFPGFFGSPHDWCPDYDGAGNMANTVQEMLLQPGVNGKLLLLPAWPQDWDVHFKLHAPRQTTVECIYRNGKVVKLDVYPQNRTNDVVFPNWLK